MFEKNMQGDVVAILNSSLTRVVEYSYDAWGNIISTTGTLASTLGTANPIRYRSYYYDTETGWYYLQSRYYNPEWGRFINADNYVNANGDLIGFNMFAYCSNNPVMFVDPCGECVHQWDFWNDCDECGGETVKDKWNSFVDGFKETKEFLEEEKIKFKNSDGTSSLYDNQRKHHGRKKYHEQLLVISPISADATPLNSCVNIGGSFTFYTGGWETESVDWSLLDFLQISAEASCDPVNLSHFSMEYGISVWSPSVTFDLFGAEISIGINLGWKSGVEWGAKNGVDLGVLSLSLKSK